MRIITNADDFGQNDDTFTATVECLEAGALAGATIMPKMPATHRAIDFAKRNPHLSFGVHLTFVRENDATPESPVSPAADVSDMVDSADGRFLPSNSVRWKALFNRISVEQIIREITAQISFLRDAGVKISHVDSHGHLHKFKPFRAALREVLPKFGIDRVRSAQDIYMKRPLKSPTFWLGGGWRRKLRAMFRTTDHFFMPGGRDADWPNRLLQHPRLRGLPDDATLEVGVHPGRIEPWRDAERKAIAEFVSVARAAGHHVIGWKDL